MRSIDYLQINLIPIIVLIIVRVSAQKTLSYSWRNRALRLIIELSACMMVIDTAAWTLNGQQFSGAVTGLWILNTIYFGMMPFIAFIWFLYVKDTVEDGLGQRGKMVLPSAVPLLIYLALLAVNRWHQLLFYIDENHCFARGKQFWICMISALLYLVAATGLAIERSRKTDSRELKKQCRLLAAFATLPFLAGVIQGILYGTALQWPFTAASLVMLYINLQREQVIRDGLTGLNNRRRLMQYIEALKPWQEEKEHWFLMLLDVDKFKTINDTYGHIVGDEVLRLVAVQLKKVYGDSKAFLGRYGGDEFIIIIKSANEEEIQRRMERMKEALARMEWGNGTPWKIQASVGCAKYDKTKMSTVSEWFELADERMYQQKNAEKNS